MLLYFCNEPWKHDTAGLSSLIQTGRFGRVCFKWTDFSIIHYAKKGMEPHRTHTQTIELINHFIFINVNIQILQSHHIIQKFYHRHHL